MTAEKKIFQPPTLSDVCTIYNLLCDRGFIQFPIIPDSENKIESILSTVEGSYFGSQRYVTDEEKSVAYLYFLIKDHPFIDGNKRTAVTFFLVYCAFHNLEPDIEHTSLDELAVYIEKLRKEEDVLFRVRVIAAVLFGLEFMKRTG